MPRKTSAQRLAACRAYAIKDNDMTTALYAQSLRSISASIDSCTDLRLCEDSKYGRLLIAESDETLTEEARCRLEEARSHLRPVLADLMSRHPRVLKALQLELATRR